MAEGYARNFLLPRKLALEATRGQYEAAGKNARRVREEGSHREGATRRSLPDCSPAFRLNLSRKAGENDQLFGSVTSADIAEALAAKGFTVDKRKIALAEPIKVVGEYRNSREAAPRSDRQREADGQKRRISRLNFCCEWLHGRCLQRPFLCAIEQERSLARFVRSGRRFCRIAVFHVCEILHRRVAVDARARVRADSCPFSEHS